MEILDPTTVEWSEPKPRNRYPWAEWLDGNLRKAEKGVDFDIAPESFRSAVISAAASLSKKRLESGQSGIGARAKVDGDTVTFQAYLLLTEFAADTDTATAAEPADTTADTATE